MRALESDALRRYESAALFADDLRRHLLEEPILARPRTFTYRAKKFLRRNRGNVMAATAVLLLLTGFLTAFLRETRKTEVMPAATGISGSSSNQKHDAVGSLRDSATEVREVIASHPQSARLSAQLYRAVAGQELGDRFNRDGDFAEAKKAYTDSVSIAESNLKSGQDAFLTIFIGSTRKLGLNAIAQGNRDEALEFGRRAVEASSQAKDSRASLLASARSASAIALIYAELFRSPLRHTGDREQAVSWFHKGLNGWQQAATKAGLGPLQEQEVQETEQALRFLESR